MTHKALDLGAQDPELRNSPVAWESDEETEALREEVPGGAACYFNGISYADGTAIRSGTTVLRCDSGLWVPEGGND
jgi:hypothetical protein